MRRLDLLNAFEATRNATEDLCRPLETEDYVIQSMADVSPPKWHLGHTTWFFEQVILQKFAANYRPYQEGFYFIFNSYYQSFGERVARDRRGTLSRPTVSEVYAYRKAIDERMRNLIVTLDDRGYEQVSPLAELGIHHEQQHQELLVTDIKHILASSSLRPIYRNEGTDSGTRLRVGKLPSRFVKVLGGIFEIGAKEAEFAFDNEKPRHRVLSEDFKLMNRLVTCGEYLDFINDGGYRNPLLWLSDGWDVSRREAWNAPLYWEKSGDQWEIITLSGTGPLEPNEPVCHVSYYEADAYARWAGHRLPTEVEWERAATLSAGDPSCGNFLEDRNYHPVAIDEHQSKDAAGISQLYGDVWEWTISSYLPYPGYKREPSALGEYNAKFMANQMVLRGGSCATPRSHIRPSYRNFFQCDKRWQFTGIRLASDT